MENTLEYKGYRGSVEYSTPDRVFHGKVIGIRSLVSYEGTDVDSLERDFREAVDDYLELCNRRGFAPEKEYSGLFQVRVSPEVHQQLAIKAESSGKKLNTVVSEALAHYIAAS
ncbi:antitoxin HicB [Clostridia bacterium]|nr:antitoxin HicB [Clostridia bacterium]